MAKFIKKVLLFFALIAIIDVATGHGFEYLRTRAKGGETQKNYYISEICNDDILIMGSSRAARHYVPQILEDSLRMSCYNCGEPGCGIITAYARYLMIEPRHIPKLVIYEVTPKYDYLKTDDYSTYLGRVRQYATKEPIANMFKELGDELEPLRLFSSMYRNNSTLVFSIADYMTKGGGSKGYTPLLGIMKYREHKPITEEENPIDSIKLNYIEKLVVKLKNEDVRLVFMASPKYVSIETAYEQEKGFGPVMDICQKYNIPFINNTYMEGISDNHEFFQDFEHLNKQGAELYTKMISNQLVYLN